MSRSRHPSRHAVPGVVVPAQLDYGIRALVTLADGDGDYTKIDLIASEHGLSAKYLAQVLVLLRDAGIVDTLRGTDGGYRLSRDPASIRLDDVFSALAPDTAPVECPATVTPGAVRTDAAWEHIAAAIATALGTLSVADLAGGTVPGPALTAAARATSAAPRRDRSS